MAGTILVVVHCETCDHVVAIPRHEIAPGVIGWTTPLCATCPGHPELKIVVRDVVAGDEQAQPA